MTSSARTHLTSWEDSAGSIAAEDHFFLLGAETLVEGEEWGKGEEENLVAEGDKRFVLLLQGTNDDDSSELFFSGKKDEAAEMQKNHCCCRRHSQQIQSHL